MPVTWEQLSGYERAEKILDNIGGLTDEEKQRCYDEWSQLTFPVTAAGIIQSEVELQKIATKVILQRQGKWEHEVNRRREALEALTRQIK